MVDIGFVADPGLRQEQVELAAEAATPTAENRGSSSRGKPSGVSDGPDQRELIGRDTELCSRVLPPMRAAKQPCGELLSLALGLRMVSPLPGLQVEVVADVHEVVAESVRDVPSKPGAGKPRSNADGGADDNLIHAAFEWEVTDLDA